MAEKKKFDNLKVGDNVFVAYQNDRYRNSKGLPIETSYETIVKVGRKFGYIRKYRDDKPFDLYTGRSHHNPDHNVRSNGGGFDVYLNPDEFKQYFEAVENAHKLSAIINKMSFISSLTAAQVKKILEVIECET
jgi:hypothetical protein